MGGEALILQDMLHGVRGEPMRHREVWRRHLRHRHWAGRGSHNLPPMAHACDLADAIRVRDLPRIESNCRWWKALLTREDLDSGVDEAGRPWYWGGTELMSGTYWGWRWLSEGTVAHLLTMHEVDDALLSLVTNRLRINALMGSLVSHPLYTLRGARGQVVWQGQGICCAGARTNVAHQRRRDDRVCLSRNSAHPVQVELHRGQPNGLPTRLADAIQWPAMSKLAATDTPATAARELRRLDVRTIVEYTVRIYQDGRRLSWISTNPNGNTGCTYAALLPASGEADAAQFLFPYGGEERPRNRRHELIGPGWCGIQGYELVAVNLSGREALRRGPRAERHEARMDLPNGDYLEVKFGPDGAPRVLDLGSSMSPPDLPPRRRPIPVA